MEEQEDQIRQLLDEAEKARRSKATGRTIGILLLSAEGVASIGVS